MSTAEKLALEVEAQLDEYPDERGEILLEAARAWLQAGKGARALELLTSALELGGEDGCYARCELGEFHLSREESVAYEQIA
jgi:hypothetical protein